MVIQKYYVHILSYRIKVFAAVMFLSLFQLVSFSASPNTPDDNMLLFSKNMPFSLSIQSIAQNKSLTFQKFKNNYFSMLVPTEWKKLEYDYIKDFNNYEVSFLFQEQEGTEYIEIKVSYFAEAYKTSERYIFDLERGLNLSAKESKRNIKNVQINGKTANVFDLNALRTPLAGSGGKNTEVYKKYFIFQRTNGLYVMYYDAPVSIASKYKNVFDKMVGSFVITDSENTKKEKYQEISDEEYALFTDFFTTQKKSDSRYPEYFDQALNASTIFETTLGKDDLPKHAINLNKEFGFNTKELVANYIQKNKQSYAIKDRILVDHINILSQKQQDQQRLNARKHGESFSERRTELLFLSKVGFNKEKNLALFHLSHSGSLGTSYYVVMEKSDRKWVIKNVALDKMVIF